MSDHNEKVDCRFEESLDGQVLLYGCLFPVNVQFHAEDLQFNGQSGQPAGHYHISLLKLNTYTMRL